MNSITREEAAALMEAATPGPWRGDRNDGTVKYAILAGEHEAPIVVLSVDHKNGTYGFGCGYGDPDETQYANDPSADERLCIVSPRLAATVVALHDRIAELEATLAAERGDPAGAVSEDWEPNGDGWSNPAGTFSSDAGRHVRPAGRNAYHGLEDGWTKAMTWYWQVDQRVDGLLMRGRGGQGWAPTAREAMRAADAAVAP